jgi:hypothetical protein
LVEDFPTISLHLKGEDEVEVDKIAREIDCVIDVRVAEIARANHLKEDQQKVLSAEVKGRRNRTYLWVYLIFEAMDNWIDWTKGDIQKQIKRLPERMLSRSPDARRTRTLLHMMLGAARPLSLEELAVSMAVNNYPESANVHVSTARPGRDGFRFAQSPEIESGEQFYTKMRELCGLLVTVSDGKVHFLHHTVVEFLIQETSLDDTKRQLYGPGSDTGPWGHSLCRDISHEILGSTCAKYLLFHDIQARFAQVPSQRLSSIFYSASDAEFLNFLQKFFPPVPWYSLIFYAWDNWFIHLRTTKNESLLFYMRQLCEMTVPSTRLRFELNNGISRASLPPLHIASFWGLNLLVKNLLADPATDPNVRVTWWGFASLAAVGLAALKKDKQVLQAFIDAESLYDETNHIVGRRRRVQFEFDDCDESPLACALHGGHIEIFKMIVATGFIAPSLEWFLYPISRWWHLQVKDLVDILAVMYDTWKNDPSLVETLRRRLVPEVVYEEDPLCLQLLLERQLFNADALHEGLWLASLGDMGIMVEMISLIDGVVANARTPDGHTSLCRASARGYSRVVQALLATHKADVNAKCVLGMAPLHLTIEQPEDSEHDYPGHSSRHTRLWILPDYDATLRVLLNARGVDVNAEDKDGYTPLILAARKGDKFAVQKLLTHRNVNVRAVDRNGRTALSWAAQTGKGYFLLLTHDPMTAALADVSGRTPLTWAAEYGRFDAVELFFDTAPTPKKPQITMGTPH